MRICLRRIPGWFGFTWWQLAFSGARWWTVEHYWAVNHIARAHRFGPIWICTMRADCVERWSRTERSP